MDRILLLLVLAAAGGNAAAATMEEAGKLFEARRWPEAAAAYQSIVQAEPQNALAHIRLARSRAASGEAEAALSALGAWFATGSGAYHVAMRVPEFESLRADPRFLAIVEPHKPGNTPEFRQFDFWAGTWDVQDADGKFAGRNSITLEERGCVLVERWKSASGGTGLSINYYDPRAKAWTQNWVGLGLILMIVFFVCWVAQLIAEWQVFTDEQRAHGEAAAVGDFVSQFAQSTLENWQSEFLQLFTFVTLAALFIHKGSAESKDGSEKVEASLRRIETKLGTLPPSAPDDPGNEWKLPDTPLESGDAILHRPSR